jgi:hypothetical protein
MDTKDRMNQAADAVKKTVDRAVDDTKDALSEAQHRGEAEGERAKRDVAGDAMTPGERAGSVVNEKVNETQAAVDKAKREVRDRTA